MRSANLSETYFTNRYDRAMVIRSAELASFYSSLVSTLSDSELAHEVNANDTRDGVRVIPPAASRAATLQSRLRGLLDPANGISLVEADEKNKTGYDTLIFPTVQMKQFGLPHDEAVTLELFQWIREKMRENPRERGSRMLLDITTGYFNFSPVFTQQFLSLLSRPFGERTCALDINLYAASQKANGWFGFGGRDDYVPQVYASISLRFLRSIKKWTKQTAYRAGDLRVYEYTRGGWSFHAKGLYLTLPYDDEPRVTVIGSSNFGKSPFPSILSHLLLL